MKIMKCDARAFARCPYKKQCSDSPEHTSFYEGTECDYFNQQVIHAPLTNADRIRSMSDWELAVAAVRYKGTVVNATRYGGHEHKFYGPHGEPCANKEHAILMWFNWLQRQAEEDT